MSENLPTRCHSCWSNWPERKIYQLPILRSDGHQYWVIICPFCEVASVGVGSIPLPRIPLRQRILRVCRKLIGGGT